MEFAVPRPLFAALALAAAALLAGPAHAFNLGAERAAERAVAPAAGLTPYVNVRFARNGFAARAAVQKGLTAGDHPVFAYLRAEGAAGRLRHAVPLFDAAESALHDLTARARARGGDTAPLTAWWQLAFTSMEAAAAAEHKLIALDPKGTVVELAYRQPLPAPGGRIGVPAPAPVPPNPPFDVPDLTAEQPWLEPAPAGLDARFIWTQPGGRGDRVAVGDVEYDWNFSHVEWGRRSLGYAGNTGPVRSDNLILQGLRAIPGVTIDFSAMNPEQGTAVLGVILAEDDGGGVTGISGRTTQVYPSTWFTAGLVGEVFSGVLFGGLAAVQTAVERLGAAQGIQRAIASMVAGDVLLVAVQFPGPNAPLGTVLTDFNNQFGYLPAEYRPADFDIIQTATGTGIHVISVAGDGHQNLNDPAFGTVFDRNARDSGAILVGAAAPPGGADTCVRTTNGPCTTVNAAHHAKLGPSNHGRRVDLHAYGAKVVSAGFGDYYNTNPNRKYTKTWGGTVAAAAMVTGATAAFQSAWIERRRYTIDPIELRTLLVETGTPQAGDLSTSVGPMPDLRAAFERLRDRLEPPEPEPEPEINEADADPIDNEGPDTADEADAAEDDGDAVAENEDALPDDGADGDPAAGDDAGDDPADTDGNADNAGDGAGDIDFDPDIVWGGDNDTDRPGVNPPRAKKSGCAAGGAGAAGALLLAAWAAAAFRARRRRSHL